MKELSLFKQNLYNKIIDGIAWCLFGLFSLFDNIPCKILSVVFIFIAVMCTFIPMVKRKEEDDEMSLRHKQHAESTGFAVLFTVIAVVGMVSIFMHEMVFNYRMIYPFVLGGAELLVGLLFVYYEKVGD